MRYPLLSFASGELSPLIDARSDTEKYLSGCRTLVNMIPRVYGVAERRPGTQYIDATTEGARLIPFIYSNEIAYMVLFEDVAAYFYYDQARVLDGLGDRLEIVSPYASGDLAAVQFKQLNDVMWLTHGSYAPRKLTRTSATAFAITAITFTRGPFLKRNDIANGDGVTLQPGGTAVGASTILTASSATFDVNHVGALFSVSQPRVNTQVAGSMTAGSTGVIGSAILVEGSYTFTTHGTWTGTVALQRSIDGTMWETVRSWTSDADRNVQLTDAEYEDGVQYRINVTALSANTAPGTTGVTSKIKAELTVNSSVQTGICRVTGYVSPLVVNVTILKAFASTNADVRWSEGCWSPYRGYPQTVTFFENRCYYGATEHQPQTIWASAVDDYENFAEGVNDDDSFSLTLASDTRNAIVWLSGTTDLLVGTTDGEWVVRSSGQGEPLTASNFSFQQQSAYGSTTIPAVAVGDATLFVDRVARKVREMTYQWEKQQYIAPDLTALAEHVTAGGLVAVAYQRHPDPILWAVRADGVLLSMTYERADNVVAWARHTLEVGSGASAGTGELAVFSAAVIPATDEDEVWISVTRVIDEQVVYYVEVMQPRRVTDRDDLWFVDSGLALEAADADGIVTGLDHLEGEEVAIYVDGAVRPRATVSGGQVDTGGAILRKAIVGLPYRYELKPMRFDLAAGGTTKGTLKRFAELVISFYETLGARYGVDTDHLFEIDWRTDEAFDSPPDLYTGDKIVTHEGGFDAEDSIVISGDDPLPCVVRALVPRIEISGR